MILDLIQNVTLLITLSVFYNMMARQREKNLLIWKIFTGVWFGLVAILGMMIPFVYEPGAIFDGRSVVLSLAGLFGGGYVSLIAGIMAGAYRLYLGGAGVWAGLSTIVLCSLIGLVFRRLFDNRPERISLIQLYGIGVVTHVFMLASQLLFPSESRWEILNSIWLPVMLVFPFAYLLIGYLLRSEDRRIIQEQQIEEDKLRFKSLFDNHVAVQLLINVESLRIEHANQAAIDFYGWSLKELTGMQIGRINTAEPHQLAKAIQDVKSRKANHFEFKHRLASGQMKDVEVFTSEVDVFGTKYLHSIVHDITEKKQLVQDLLLAKEKAEESDRLKSAFLANMSHEIRTPLNGILGFTELLTDEEELPVELNQRYAGVINSSAENLIQIIDDILDISKLESGLLRIQKENFDLSEMLSHVDEIYRKKFIERKKSHIRLDCVAAKDSFLIVSDPRRLYQVMTNLLDNALKFTDEGYIRYGWVDADGAYVRLFVEDTGIGISPDKHEIIFERFAQADADASLKRGGAGLGLSIVKKLVTLLDGTIELTSLPGQGTRFTVTLPVE